MRTRKWLLATLGVLALSTALAGPALAGSRGGHAADEEFDDATPDPPLPPGLKERVFIHLPRAHSPNHLGTCTATQSEPNDWEAAGWRLPDAGITWRLNPSTIPANVSKSAATTAIQQSFGAWTAVDGSKQFFQGSDTSVTRPRFDAVNAVLWGRVAGNAIGVTYVRYYTATGIVEEVDTVFNNRLPWAVFDSTADCESSLDAYDVENIATHEFGHWIGLDDLYSSADKDLTMYGYGAGGELKKRSLGTGDITGTNQLLP
jgi:hypothetical protein